MAPSIADIVTAGVSVIKVDIDRVAGATEYWGITSVPTFIRFRAGVERDRRVGAMGKADLLLFSGILESPLFS